MRHAGGDRLVTLKNLAVNLTLIVVPDLAPWLREYNFDRQKESHLFRLENPALRIDKRDALVVEREAGLQLGRGQAIVDFAEPADVLEGGHAHESVAIWFIHAPHPCVIQWHGNNKAGKRAREKGY